MNYDVGELRKTIHFIVIGFTFFVYLVINPITSQLRDRNLYVEQNNCMLDKTFLLMCIFLMYEVCPKSIRPAFISPRWCYSSSSRPWHPSK